MPGPPRSGGPAPASSRPALRPNALPWPRALLVRVVQWDSLPCESHLGTVISSPGAQPPCCLARRREEMGQGLSSAKAWRARATPALPGQVWGRSWAKINAPSQRHRPMPAPRAAARPPGCCAHSCGGWEARRSSRPPPPREAWIEPLRRRRGSITNHLRVQLRWRLKQRGGTDRPCGNGQQLHPHAQGTEGAGCPGRPGCAGPLLLHQQHQPL